MSLGKISGNIVWHVWECFKYGSGNVQICTNDKCIYRETCTSRPSRFVVPGRTFAQSLSCPRMASRLESDSSDLTYLTRDADKHHKHNTHLLKFVHVCFLMLFAYCLLHCQKKTGHGHSLLCVPGCVGFFIVATEYVSSPATFACLSTTKFR